MNYILLLNDVGNKAFVKDIETKCIQFIAGGVLWLLTLELDLITGGSKNSKFNIWKNNGKVEEYKCSLVSSNFRDFIINCPLYLLKYDDSGFVSGESQYERSYQGVNETKTSARTRQPVGKSLERKEKQGIANKMANRHRKPRKTVNFLRVNRLRNFRIDCSRIVPNEKFKDFRKYNKHYYTRPTAVMLQTFGILNEFLEWKSVKIDEYCNFYESFSVRTKFKLKENQSHTYNITLKDQITDYGKNITYKEWHNGLCKHLTDNQSPYYDQYPYLKSNYWDDKPQVNFDRM